MHGAGRALADPSFAPAKTAAAVPTPPLQTAWRFLPPRLTLLPPHPSPRPSPTQSLVSAACRYAPALLLCCQSAWVVRAARHCCAPALRVCCHSAWGTLQQRGPVSACTHCRLPTAAGAQRGPALVTNQAPATLPGRTPFLSAGLSPSPFISSPSPGLILAPTGAPPPYALGLPPTALPPEALPPVAQPVLARALCGRVASAGWEGS